VRTEYKVEGALFDARALGKDKELDVGHEDVDMQLVLVVVVSRKVCSCLPATETPLALLEAPTH
jgi:hypothetical protein